MYEEQNKQEECMGCACPCEMHKEHNHDVAPEQGAPSVDTPENPEPETPAPSQEEWKEDEPVG